MGKSLNFFTDNGRIDNTAHCAACRYNCCTTDQDNFIVLFHWELAAATRAGLTTDHLQPINGNPRHVHCTRPCTGITDYKPVNCATYPLYPITEDLKLWVRGAKNRCPIGDIRLGQQTKHVANALRKIEKIHPGSIKTLVDFIRGYPGELEVLEYGPNGKMLTPKQIIAAHKIMTK